MSAVQFTHADRDDRGFIKAAAAPRPLADLLPLSAPASDPTITRQPPTRVELAAIVALAFLLIGMLAYLGSSAPARTAAPPTHRAPTALPTALPTIPVAMLPAYGAPNEAPRWEIESTRVITPLAHFGDDWIQARVAGSGLIWLRAADLPGVAIVGPDLAPRRPAAAPAAVEPRAAESTPEPQPPCLTAGTGAQTVTVCDWLSPEQLRIAAAVLWAETYGGNVGTVSTPSPYGGPP